jgi:hypothetical protein
VLAHQPPMTFVFQEFVLFECRLFEDQYNPFAAMECPDRVARHCPYATVFRQMSTNATSFHRSSPFFPNDFKAVALPNLD